jgi:hypothetical protein
VEEVFIAVPRSVTLDAIGDVLRQRWTLDESMSQPQVVLDDSSRAYVAELDHAEVEDDPLFFEDPGTPATLRDHIGDYRLFSLRYTDPALARAMTRAIAASRLAETPMLINSDGSFVTPVEFLRRPDASPA